jgi:hypothetical protein
MTAFASAIPIPVKIRPIHRVLESRERRLRGQLLALHRVAITQELLNRVRSQSTRVISVRVAAANRIQLLAHQITDRVADFARLMSLIDPVDQRRGQPEASIARLQQDPPAIGTGVRLVESSHHRAA